MSVGMTYTRTVNGRAEGSERRNDRRARDVPFLLSLRNIREGKARIKHVLLGNRKENEIAWVWVRAIYFVIILRVCKQRYDAYRISVISFHIHAYL